METAWFCLVAWMLAMYVILDGFDLGAGILHLHAGRTDAERRMILRSIGPLWDGNEVWLLAAGGTLFFAFPPLYASSFSGFYLPLMMVLWLLMIRGISIEFRNHIEDPVWRPLWDAGFCVSSALLAVFFGAALGNVIRGVPLAEDGTFFEPLWTDFGTEAPTGILDWYTVLAGLTALAALAHHGALWIAMKLEGAPSDRARAAAGRTWWALGLFTFVLTGATFQVQPHCAARFGEAPWGAAFPALALAGLLGAKRFRKRGHDAPAFLSSCLYLAGMMASVAFSLYPYVLPARPDLEGSLTVWNSAAGPYGLRAGLWWWVPGIFLAGGYFFFAYRRFSGKVSAEEGGY